MLKTIKGIYQNGQVHLTEIAEAQIEQAYCWYRERNPELADRWFRGLMNAIA